MFTLCVLIESLIFLERVIWLILAEYFPEELMKIPLWMEFY